MIPPFLLSMLKEQLQDIIGDVRQANSSRSLNFSSLRQGDIIEGKVVGRDGSIDILDYNGQRLRAKSQVELPMGAKVRLRVARPSNPLEVRLEAVVQKESKSRLDPSDKLLSRFQISYSRLKGLVERLANRSPSMGQEGLSPSEELSQGKGILEVIGLSDESGPGEIEALSILHEKGGLKALLNASAEISDHEPIAMSGERHGTGSGMGTAAETVLKKDVTTKNQSNNEEGPYAAEPKGVIKKGQEDDDIAFAKKGGDGLQKVLKVDPKPNAHLIEGMEDGPGTRTGQPLSEKALAKGESILDTARQGPASSAKADSSLQHGDNTFQRPNVQAESDGQGLNKLGRHTGLAAGKVAQSDQEGSSLVPGPSAIGSRGEADIPSRAVSQASRIAKGEPGQAAISSGQKVEKGRIRTFRMTEADMSVARDANGLDGEGVRSTEYGMDKTRPRLDAGVKRALASDPGQSSKQAQTNPLGKEASSSSTGLDNLKHTMVKEFSNHVELAGQVQNHVFNETGLNLFIFPVIFSQMEGVGQWSYWTEHDSQQSSEGPDAGVYHLSFDLYLKGLGQMNIHILKKEDSLSLYLAADKDKLPFIRQGLSDITARIKALGYRFEAIECHALDEEQAPVVSSALFEGGDGHRFHLIT